MQVTYSSYVSGFLLSLILTLVAFYLVANHTLSGAALLYTVVGLAVCQVAVQLLLFLHLAHEPKPRRNLMTFLFMAMVVVIIVGGSLWIINTLNYNTMS